MQKMVKRITHAKIQRIFLYHFAIFLYKKRVTKHVFRMFVTRLINNDIFYQINLLPDPLKQSSLQTIIINTILFYRSADNVSLCLDFFMCVAHCNSGSDSF